MPGVKRSKAQRGKDLKRLGELVREGKSQVEMAEALGISQQQVSEDLAKLRPLWIEEARAVLEGTAVEAAVKVRQIVTAPYSDPSIAAVRLRGAEAVLDRVGLPKTTKSENKHDFSRLSDEELLQLLQSSLGRGGKAGAETSEG